MKRIYADGCAIANALNMVGERWALLIVRELLLGPKRFADLQSGLPGAGPTILAQRLRDLETAGVLHRRVLPRPAAATVYELTTWGAELEPIVIGLGRWGARSPVVAPTGEAGPDSHILSLRAFFRPRPGSGWNSSYEIRLGDAIFAIRVVDGELTEVSRGESAVEPTTRIDTDPATFGELLASRLPLSAARASGRLTLTGSSRAAQRLFSAARP